MIKNSTLFIFCLSTLMSFGQSKEYSIETKIAPDDLKTDFAILVTSLKENHPGLYDFTPKPEFDSLVIESLGALTDSLTESEFHIVIRKFLHVIGCGHTGARPSEDWYQAIDRENAIPFHVYLHKEQLYVRWAIGKKAHELMGKRILSIDGVSVSEILPEMKSILGRDGIGETMIDRNVEKLFQTLYIFLYGTSEQYAVEFAQGDTSSIIMKLSGEKAVRYSTQKPEEFGGDIEIKGARFGFIGESRDVAVLDLNSFPSKGHKKFYREVFKELTYHDSIDLVIDLRGNGGGYFPNGNLLLRYLMNEEFTMDFDKPQKHTKNSKYLKLDFMSHITRFIFSTIPDRNKKDPDRNYQIRYKPIKKNHFSGDVYILTDGWTFSTGSFVASKLKNGREAVVVGEETGGGEVGFNAVLKWRLNLPSSGVVVLIPMYHVDMQPEMQDLGRGVVPDVEISYDLEQRLFEVDLEMQYILDNLKAN